MMLQTAIVASENTPRPEYSSPMDADAFEILGIEPGFEIDLEEVEQAFLARLASIHPDVAREGDSALLTARLNAAREVLEDPERRAWALVSRLTGGEKVQDRSLPDGFLPEIMEVREEVETAVASGDASRLASWREWARDRRAQHMSRVTGMFNAMVEGGGRPGGSAVRDLIRELNAWRYIERLIEQVSEVEGRRAELDDRAP